MAWALIGAGLAFATSADTQAQPSKPPTPTKQPKPQQNPAEPARLDMIVVDGSRVFGHNFDGRHVEAISLRRTYDHSDATHASESLSFVPGVWISRGSGQEQLTAIRSPVLTGSGACGAFLMLEDGVPMRPAAFCNVNQLAELPTELAGGIEVLRGPGRAEHGSNALHGVINVRPPLFEYAAHQLTFAAGGHDFARVSGTAAADDRWRVDAVATDAGSFRLDEHVAQQKLVAQWQDYSWPGGPRLLFSASRLDQDTAGFVGGRDAHRDARRFGNANPEAFRRGHALRLQGRWEWQFAYGESLTLVPFARSDGSQFLQHFNLGQPLEENRSDSIGMQLRYTQESNWYRYRQLGFDLEFASGELIETQAHALTTGSAAQQAIRPRGRHYDYRANTVNAAAFAQWDVALAERWLLQGGLRAEAHRFAYDNRVGDGNLRDDGSACDFGGCLFNRPSDRKDQFADASGNIGLQFAVTPRHSLVTRWARAFRVPQAGELYRLQRGQAVADLQSETLHGPELGWRSSFGRWQVDIDAYDYRKQHVILRDAAGFNVSDGRTRHRGIETSMQLPALGPFSIQGHIAFSDQRYAFDRDAAAGEQIRRGNRVDTAPRWLGGATFNFDLPWESGARLEWRHQGSYELDAANSARYPGHDLLNLHLGRHFGDSWQLGLRVMNLINRRYAERADFAFGQYRYFPGAGREVFVSLQWRDPNN